MCVSVGGIHCDLIYDLQGNKKSVLLYNNNRNFKILM